MPTEAHPFKCPDCGATEFEQEERGLSLLIRCLSCGQEAATTNYNDPAFDETRYTVWLEFDPGDRQAAISAMALSLAQPLKEMREQLDAGRPIASDVLAQRVFELHDSITPKGFSLRVSPSFRWKLGAT